MKLDTTAGMNVVAGQGRLRPLATPAAPPRSRPGEAPAWVSVSVSPAEGRDWRQRAKRHGIGVDAWLGIVLEAHVVAEFLGSGGAWPDEMRDALASTSADARLAPTDALRRWVRLLEGQFADDGAALADELPTVVLGERLIAQVPARLLTETMRAATSTADEDLAIACDRAAALHGVTLESWVLRQALSRSAR